MSLHNAVVRPCAICEGISRIEVHHVVNRSQGGMDGPTLPLCKDHHDRFTREEWELQYITLDGEVVIPTGSFEPPAGMGFRVIEVPTGLIVCENMSVDSPENRARIEGLWTIQRALEAMREFVPTFTNEHLRSAWDALNHVDHDLRQLRMAILHTCWKRAPQGSRIEVIDSLGRMFGISPALVYDYIRVYADLAERLPTTRVGTQLLIEATRGPANKVFGDSQRALDHIERRIDEDGRYSVRDFRRDVANAGSDMNITGFGTGYRDDVVPTTSGRTVRGLCQLCGRESDFVIIEDGVSLRVVS